MMMRDRGRLRALLPPLALLALAACGRTEAKLPPESEVPVAPIPVSVVPATERLLPAALEVTGTLVPDAQTDIPADLEQRIAEVLVERGQLVAAGEVVARLEAEDARNVLRETQAVEAQIRERLGIAAGQPFDPLKTPEVSQARAALDRAEADYRRFARLLEEGAVSRAEHDLRRADYLMAKAQHETAVNQMRQLYQSLAAQKVRVAMAKKALEDSVVRAPYAGLIAERHVSVGRFMKKGERIATLVRIDPLRIELTVPEGAMAAVRTGQKVSFAVQTYPDRRFEGTVAYIGPAVKAESRALVVEAVVPNPRGLLRPGLFATAGIQLPAATPSVMAPAAALRNDGGLFTLFVAAGERAELRIVQVGREADGAVEILRGLRPGEPVIAAAVPGLSDGAPIALAR